MICTHCGNQLPEGSSFCTKCGWPTTSSSTTPTATPQAVQAVSASTSTAIQTGFFKGRIGRLRYFEGHLVGLIPLAVVYGALLLLALVTNNGNTLTSLFDLVIIIGSIVSILSWILVDVAITIRRCHDLGYSGWFGLALLVPFINIFFGLYLLFKKGIEADNEYGPIPLYRPILKDTFNSGTIVLAAEKQKRVETVGGRLIIIFFVVVPIVGILSSIVLVSLNDARQKAAIANTGLTSNWQPYTLDSGFQILFPSTPTTTTQNLTTQDGIPYTAKTYIASEASGANFASDELIYAQAIDTSDPDSLLQNMLDSYVAAEKTSRNGVLVSSDFGYHGAYRSLDYTIKMSDSEGDYFTKGQFILVSDTLVLVVLETYASDTYSDQEYQSYINSLQSN